MATTDSTSESQPRAQTTGGDPFRAVIPYVLPMFGYLALTALEGYLPTGAGGAPSPFWYPLAYSVKVAVVAGLMVACRSTWRDLSPWPGVGALALSLALGLVVTVVWVGLDGYYPTFSFGGTRAEFNPNSLPRGAHQAFVAVRL